MENVTIASNQKVLVTANPVDAGNYPTTVFNGPEWVTSDSHLVNLSTAGFSPSCEVSAKGVPGVATVTIKGQPNASSPVVQTSFTVTITAGQLVGFAPTFGVPVNL